MSVEAIIGLLIAIVIGLVGIIYASLRSEAKRNAKNIHSLRNIVQSIIMTLAARGIKVPRKGDDS